MTGNLRNRRPQTLGLLVEIKIVAQTLYEDQEVGIEEEFQESEFVKSLEAAKGLVSENVNSLVEVQGQEFWSQGRKKYVIKSALVGVEGD